MRSIVNLEEIRSLAEVMRAAELTSLEVEETGLHVIMEKQPSGPPSSEPAARAAGVPVQAAPEKAEEPLRTIKSPMVGVFYTAPSPEGEPYVRAGSAVKKGDVICMIEAMKLLNEINCDQDGTIAEICAENGQVVEYGQTLFKLR